MKSGRSIVGGFFSYKIRGYWPLLLRLWLGISWLFEGINKIGEGWLAFSSGSKSGWMFSSGIVQAGVSAASAAGTAASPAPAAFHDIWDLTKPILDPQSGIVHWFKRIFMDGLFAYLPYSIFQSTVVAAEIGIGLIFLGGFFTWFGAVASIGLTLVFTLSGMFRWDQAWFFFAAIVMMGGAGRAFGLDYWSVPLFKKWWNGTRLARRTHLYGDDPTK
jgi:NADH dehydrogenase